MIKNNSRADDLEADISQFIYLFLSKISLQFPRNTTRGGRANRDRYIKQDHTEFIVTGLRINPGCTVHTTRHVIPKLRPSVYFFPYCLNCLDLVIVKPQVKDTRHCLAGCFFFLQPTYASPIWPGEVCCCETGRAGKYWSSSFSLLASLTAVLSSHCFSISVTHVLSPHLCLLRCLSAWFLSLSRSLLFFISLTLAENDYVPDLLGDLNVTHSFFWTGGWFLTAVCG